MMRLPIKVNHGLAVPINPQICPRFPKKVRPPVARNPEPSALLEHKQEKKLPKPEEAHITQMKWMKRTKPKGL